MAALWQGVARLFAPILDPIMNPLVCLPPLPEAAPRLSAEALLRQLDARLRQRLSTLDVGERDSLRRGQGLDFAELREYYPGDDIRKMDWNVFARTLTPHVREYHEEKRQTFWILVDCTPSMAFGRSICKWDVVLTLAGYLGLLARQGGHRLGVVLMRETGSELLSPQAGELGIRQLLKRVLAAMDALGNGQQETLQAAKENKGVLKSKKQSINSSTCEDPLTLACRQLARVAEKQSIVFLLSDFLSWSAEANVQEENVAVENPAPSPDWQKALGQLSRQVRLIAMPVYERVEMALPQVGLLPVYDPETGAIVQLDTDHAAFRLAYEAEMCANQQRLFAYLGKISQLVPVSCEEEPLDVLLRLLKGSGFYRGLS